jgi:hypothetical protein
MGIHIVMSRQKTIDRGDRLRAGASIVLGFSEALGGLSARVLFQAVKGA